MVKARYEKATILQIALQGAAFAGATYLAAQLSKAVVFMWSGGFGSESNLTVVLLWLIVSLGAAVILLAVIGICASSLRAITSGKVRISKHSFYELYMTPAAFAATGVVISML